MHWMVYWLESDESETNFAALSGFDKAMAKIGAEIKHSRQKMLGVQVGNMRESRFSPSRMCGL